MRISPALLLAASALASPGDNLDDFQDCMYQCEHITCFQNPYHLVQEEHREILEKKNFDFQRYEPEWRFSNGEIPWYMKLLQWDCSSNCDYQCQQIITKERISRDEEVLQFHGKWPFTRVFGIQEIASMVFSLLNFVPHYIGYYRISEAVNQLSSRKKSYLKSSLNNIRFLSVVTMAAWLCSTVFHIRDTPTTEKFDYYFAGLTVLTGFYCTATRYFKLYLPARAIPRWLLTLTCIGAYAGHIYRLETDWSYAYNMQANIFVGVLQNILWGALCFELYTKFYALENSNAHVLRLDHLQYIHSDRVIMSSFYTRSAKLYSLYPLLLCSIVLLGMSLEIFDFPPVLYNLVDAHSLWHLVTVLPAFMGWYDWVAWDISENVWDDLQEHIKKKEE